MQFRQLRNLLGAAGLVMAGVVHVASADASDAPRATPPLSTPAGVGPLIDLKSTLAAKLDYDVNSWFAIGYFTAGGHTLSYLYHVMITPGPDGKPVIQSVLSITDETTGWYRSGDVVLPFNGNMMSGPGVTFKLPNGEMGLSLDDIHVKATLADGSFDLRMQPESPVLYNGGVGAFPLLGMTINEYSIPKLKTAGTITIEGKTYEVNGVSWFDRQWQNAPKGTAGGASPALKWSWMGLNLGNGDAVSLWSAPDPSAGAERAWATILHHDGSQTVAAVEPSLGATDEWLSEKSGNRYPTRWSVRIPAINAVLDVLPRPRRQEIISVVPALTKYEGASDVSGTYAGKPVEGVGYVELVGDWK